MNDQPTNLVYEAPPGVELRKALVPYDHAAALEALRTGVIGQAGKAETTQYVRAPELGGPRQQVDRQRVTRRINR